MKNQIKHLPSAIQKPDNGDENFAEGYTIEDRDEQEYD